MSRFIVATYSAAGGPPESGIGPDGFPFGPTNAGDYVVAYCGKHRSRRYPQWSSIPWGAPLKDDEGELLARVDGRWQRVSDLTGGATKSTVMSYYEDLYFVRKVPATWVFNDFGHLTCYIFKDKNRNGRLDPAAGERIHGEFFHTTPPNEAATALGRPVRLEPSHGCIHLKPLELDEMVRRGYMAKGTKVVVHPYTEKLVRFGPGRATAPFELHLYPGIQKLLVVGQGRR